MPCKTAKDPGPKGSFGVWCLNEQPSWCDTLEESRKLIISRGRRGAARCVIEGPGNRIFSGLEGHHHKSASKKPKKVSRPAKKHQHKSHTPHMPHTPHKVREANYLDYMKYLGHEVPVERESYEDTEWRKMIEGEGVQTINGLRGCGCGGR